MGRQEAHREPAAEQTARFRRLATTEAASVSWHAIGPEESLGQLGVAASVGLTETQIRQRAAQYGANRLEAKPPRPVWLRFLDQFKSLLIIVLLVAAAFAALVGDVKDAGIICAVLILNAVLGFVQEYRAERSLDALKRMLPLRSRVRRAGELAEIAAEELVPGDIVLLEAGDRVPADGRVIAAHLFEVAEATLTGESLPVSKNVDKLIEFAALGDRTNMVWMNTTVTRGRAEMAVTATGMRTEMGRLSQTLAETPESVTPLQRQLDGLGKRLAVMAVLLVAILFGLDLLSGEALSTAVVQAIALAVAAMPEGLPAVVTVTLALGMHRMAHQRAVMRKMAAVETLGCTTVICSDKTGTLTLNQMTARAVFFADRRFAVSGAGYASEGAITPEGDLRSLLVALALCNDSQVREGQAIGDPTEAALLVLAEKGGVTPDRERAARARLGEIPFDSAYKFMATFHAEGDGLRVYVKGAPEVVLDRCAAWHGPDGERPLDVVSRRHLIQQNQELAGEGLRVLAVATGILAADTLPGDAVSLETVRGLTLTGLVGLMDPPRPEATAAIALCRAAGITVKMITGDQKDTAVAIARDLGLDGEALTGAELEAMHEPERLRTCVQRVSVFCRVTPEHKVRIVEALKALGEVVAMTGDGVNDAPALKAADIGVAMGATGTEVAKEASSLVLTDDNFATIVSAVREGRALYDNIVKFVRFQLSTVMGAVLVVFWAPLLGLPDPLNPVQILWVAMIMDGPPAVALGLDPASPAIMTEPPRRPGAQLLTLRRFGIVLGLGLVMLAGTLGVLWYGLQTRAAPQALTMAFTTFVFFQVFNVFNARFERRSMFSATILFRNRLLWISLSAVVALQVLAVMWPPTQVVFGTSALSVDEWIIAVAAGASILVVAELVKVLARLRPYRRR
jgi:Ca2+-transporting ATPase